jgi:hypothetical protein
MILTEETKKDLAKKYAEYLKCKKDPIYFIETYIRNFQYDNEPIKLREKQKEIIRALLNDHKVIINGSRQTGKTTVILLFMCWLVAFHKNYTAFVMSKKGESTAELLKEFFGYFMTIPEWLRPRVIKDNAFTKEFANGSRVKGVTVPKGKEDEAGRGMKGGFIFLDEVAFFDADIEKIYTALIPTTTYVFGKYEEKGYPYGIVLVSTPNGTYGRGKFFFEMWTKALKGEIDFKPIRYHWSDVPEYRNDPEWILKKKREFHDERLFNQEYELVFLGSQDAFLPDSVIEKLQKFDYPVLESIRLPSGGKLDIYEKIDPAKFYLIGIDTATGFASDYSAIILVDYETGLPIAEYEEKIPIEDFKKDILAIPEALQLENFLFIPENNGVGSSISQWLATTQYHKNLYYDTKTGTKKKVPGLSTNAKTRPLMLEALYETVAENAELIKPKRLKSELIAVERKGSRIEAPDPFHDDTVFAYSFALYVRLYGDSKYFVQANKHARLVEKAKTIIATKQLQKKINQIELEIERDAAFNNFFKTFNNSYKPDWFSN